MNSVERAEHVARISLAGAVVRNGFVTLYRSANVPVEQIKKLRYGDYLSAARSGLDASGNAAADTYGENCVEFSLPVGDVIVNGAGEFQFKGASASLENGTRYPIEIYRAYNDVYGSNYTSEEVDAQSNVREVASQGLSGGRSEFDWLLAEHLGRIGRDGHVSRVQQRDGFDRPRS